MLRRRVYPDLRLQQLAAAGALDGEGRPHSVQALLDAGLPARLDAATLAWLQASGLLDARRSCAASACSSAMAASWRPPWTTRAPRPRYAPTCARRAAGCCCTAASSSARRTSTGACATWMPRGAGVSP
ncbi:hypothetical protein I0E98_06035 [Pseudomonas lalucatii]|nr:hypothetical protein [Pseudomonas lalucatii]